MMRAPAIAQSMSFSVRMEAQAMEVVQPRKLAGVSRIAEVIENGFAEHS